MGAGTNVGLCPGSGCPVQIAMPVLPVPVREEDLDIFKEGLCTDQSPPRTSPRPGVTADPGWSQAPEGHL